MFFARLDQALFDFQHPGLDDRHDVWDLRHAATTIRDRAEYVQESKDGRCADVVAIMRYPGRAVCDMLRL